MSSIPSLSHSKLEIAGNSMKFQKSYQKSVWISQTCGKQKSGIPRTLPKKVWIPMQNCRKRYGFQCKMVKKSMEFRCPPGGTPLNNPPIEIHANSSMFALIFWPHVTIFCIFWLHECLKWILEFNSKSLFWCQSRQILEVRAIEQRHHEFQLTHMPPHQFWPRYHCDGLSPVHVRFEFFSKQICNVEALICHFYKNIKTLTQIHFPRDAHIFRTCTIFYRHYKGLHQMRKDLVLCALHRGRFIIFWNSPMLNLWLK